MCIESSIAIARLLHIYEKHYTFRRMNNQVVSMIFSAALILLYVTISSTPLASRTGFEQLTDNSTEMVAYLNLCFRALDELGQSFENAKRTRDFLVSLQRRWQARMRRSGAMKRQISSNRPAQSSNTRESAGSAIHRDSSATRKKTRVSAPTKAHNHSASFSLPTTPPQIQPANEAGYSADFDIKRTNPQNQGQSHNFSTTTTGLNLNPAQHSDIDSWIRDSDLGILPDNITDTTTAAASAFRMGDANPNAEVDGVEVALPSLEDIEPWWDPEAGNATGAFGSSL